MGSMVSLVSMHGVCGVYDSVCDVYDVSGVCGVYG